MRPFEIAVAHAEIRIDEQEVGKGDGVGRQLTRGHREASRTRNIPGSMGCASGTGEPSPSEFRVCRELCGCGECTPCGCRCAPG